MSASGTSAAVFEAACAGEVAQAVRAAAADQEPVLPCGRRTRLRRHLPEAAPARWLSVAPMTRVIALEPQDQVCVVEPGVSPAALDEALRSHGLELAVAAPCAREGTIGGLFLAPDVSLLRAAWGPPRDQVLGGRWCLADGTLVRTGARVVKSVAGYDVTRLFLGSRGRLAVCVELTLRLRPRPRHERWHRIAADQIPRWIAPGPGDRIPARMLFSCGDEDAAWAQTDGVSPPAGAFQREADRAEGRAALERCLAGFAAARERVALPPHRARALAAAEIRRPWDWLSAVVACDDGAGLAARAGLEPSQARIVPPPPSPWLHRLQQAAAPGAPPLGGTRE